MPSSSIQRVLFALGLASEQFFPDACKSLCSDSMSADELRQFVQIYLDDTHNVNCRKYWKPLTSEEKQEALRLAIPDGTYPDQWTQEPF